MLLPCTELGSARRENVRCLSFSGMIMHGCPPGWRTREAICETRWCYVSPSIQPRFGPHQTSIGLLQWRMSFVDESLGFMTRLQRRQIWQTPLEFYQQGIHALPGGGMAVGKDGRLSRKLMFLNKISDYSYTKFSSLQSVFVSCYGCAFCITQRSTECTSIAGHSSQHNITQHGMLPQYPTGTAKLMWLFIVWL